MRAGSWVSLILNGGLLLPPTSAWYLEVHNQIGYVADQLLEPQTKYMLSQILEPEYNGSVGKAAAWADTVSRTTAKYSYGWHWISARDNPPDNCGLYYHRDCQEGGCVVQQIANQTKILLPCVQALRDGKYTASTDCQQALKWTIHFVMDVAQPMHTSERALGGNTFKVKFAGKETNMHQVGKTPEDVEVAADKPRRGTAGFYMPDLTIRTVLKQTRLILTSKVFMIGYSSTYSMSHDLDGQAAILTSTGVHTVLRYGHRIRMRWSATLSTGNIQEMRAIFCRLAMQLMLLRLSSYSLR
jgi:hypothetical protein